MREKASKSVPEAFMESGYMIERLFLIINELFTKVPKESIDHAFKQGLGYLKLYFRKATLHRTGPTEKDRYKQRKKLKRDKRRKVRQYDVTSALAKRGLSMHNGITHTRISGKNRYLSPDGLCPCFVPARDIIL